MLSKNIQIYLKTTETCNLNCKHCFTSGSSGRKIFFDPIKTSNFIKNLIEYRKLDSVRIVFHGGEPLLAPVESLKTSYNLTKELNCSISYGLQTNLVFPLTEEKLNFLNLIKPFGIGTSWDKNIRFGSINPNDPNLKKKQLNIWENNVRKLSKLGFDITLMVCINADIINMQPYELINYASDLGIKYILFERITGNGNANLNPDIFPKNLDVDKWLLKMYLQTIEFELYKKINNMFLNEIAFSFLKKAHIGNRCRNCEQSLITINADGTLSGCPNSANEKIWGDINQNIETLLSSKIRVGAICKELTRNKVCHTCPVKDACNGDCYKLPWEDDICAAPKSLMKFIRENNDYANLEKLIFD
jgi:uncharacterized protein